MTVESDSDGAVHVLKTPVWILVVRGFQFLLTLVIAGLAGRLMHDAYLDEEGLALAMALITWVMVGYIVLAEKLPSLHKLYNVIAVLVLDGFLLVMWLATFAAAAAERARYVYNVNVESCYSDGSLIDSKTCVRKRGVILFKSGAAMFAAIAGLGALVWLLFIATFAWGMTMYFRGRKEGRFLFGVGSNDHQMENQQPFVPAPQGAQPEKIVQPAPAGQYQVPPAGQYPVPPAGQYPPQAHYPQAGYQPSVSPPPTTPSPYQAPYSQAQELQGQQQQQQQQQQHYGQYPQHQGYQGQQPPYLHHTVSVQTHHGELDANGQQYLTPSPPTGSPPPHHQ